VSTHFCAIEQYTSFAVVQAYWHVPPEHAGTVPAGPAGQAYSQLPQFCGSVSRLAHPFGHTVSPDEQPALPEELPDAPEELPDAPDELPDAPDEPLDVPDELPDEPFDPLEDDPDEPLDPPPLELPPPDHMPFAALQAPSNDDAAPV
jgi:hypothetical protein